MATYQPGVTDYISQIQPTEPNLAFDAQILQTKQTKFDANHQKISELYGSILNSAMSRNDNIVARDQFVKNINNDIVKMAGMDFSLDENVDAAANVFQAIYNNDHIVKDMVWTKNFQNEKSRGQALRNCVDPDKCGGQAWEQGDQYMEYKLKEFKDATNDESLGFENVEYIPYTNMMDKAMKYAKDNKLEISSDQLIGNYMVTTKNGPQAYGPLAELFTNLYANDPKLLKQYEAQAYVNRKNNVGSIMSETGLDENAATSEYYRRQGTVQQEKINSILEQSNADEEYITGRMSALEEKIKTGKFGKTSGVVKEYNALQQLLPGAQQASQYIKLAKMTAEKANDNTYIRNVASQLDARDAAIFMHQDITGAAKTIADNTMTEKKEADEFAKLSVAHQYDVMMEGIKQTNRVALETHKASLKADESNPFAGKSGKEAKDLANTTVSGYIDDKYKQKYGDDKVSGVYDLKLAQAKATMEKLKDAQDDKEYIEAKATIAKLKPLNDENIRRQKVQKLDASGIKPITGGSFGTLYGTDKKASGRTEEDYKNKKKSATTGVSKTLGSVHGILNGSNQEDHTPEAVDQKIQQTQAATTVTHKDVTPSNVPALKQFAINNSTQLSKEQKKYYENLTPNSVIPDSIKKKIASTVNKIQESNKAVIKPKNSKEISAKNVNADVIQEVIDTHPDPKVVAKYKELKKQGVSNLSEDIKKNIAGRYNKLKTQSFTMLGETTQDAVTTSEAYRTHYSELNATMHRNTSTVNTAYLNALEKNSPEYNVLKTKALAYVKKNGVRIVDKAVAARWKGTGDPNTGVSYKIAGQVFKESDISKYGLNYLIDNDANFSKSLYKTVKTKLINATDKIKDLSKNAKVNNALFNIDNIEEDLENHIKLKHDNHSDILAKMKEQGNYDHPFNPAYIKNGFLVGFDEFYKTMQYHTDYDVDDAKEEYQNYREAYHEGLDATLTEKATKDKKYLSRGVGSHVSKLYGADNVNMQAESNATDDIFGFLGHFNQVSPNDKVLYVDGRAVEDPKEIRKYVAEIKRSKEYFNTVYKVQGEDDNVKSEKYTWEGLTLTNAKTGLEYSFTSNPAIKPSSMYLSKVQSTKDRSLQQTGKTLLSSGNDYTNKEKVYVVQKKDGTLKFEGKVHVDGKDEDLNTFLYNSEKDYNHTLSSFEDAAAVFQDIMDDLENK